MELHWVRSTYAESVTVLSKRERVKLMKSLRKTHKIRHYLKPATMECEMRALRRELEETRTALKLQTVRCRQLVAAFTTKLQEKEMEVRAGRELRDQQLGRVLRALLVLEARLKKEQRHIRQQLYDRDQVISTQQQEIDRLKTEKAKAENKLHQQQTVLESSKERSEPNVSAQSVNQQTQQEKIQSPHEKSNDESTSSQQEETNRRLPIPQNHGFKPSKPTAFVRFKKNGRHFGSYRPISRRREIIGEDKCFNACRRFDPNAHELDDSLENGHEDEFGSRDLYKDYQHNPVLECVNQILLRDHEEMETNTYKPDNKTTGRFHYQCHSIKEQDEEETSGEDEVVEAEKQENEKSQCTESQSSNETSKTNTETDTVNQQSREASNEPVRWSVKDKTPSPPIKAQLLEEKACLQMASQRLTIVSNLEFEEVDKKDTNENQNSSPPPKLPIRNGFSSNKSLVPPALPPKPPQLGAKGFYHKKINNLRANQNFNSTANQHHLTNGDQKQSIKFCTEPLQDTNESHNENSEKNTSNEHQKSVHQDNRMNQASHLPENPRQRQILSNGSLKLALNQESNQQTFSNGHDHHQDNNNFCITSTSFEEKLENMNLSDFQNHSNSLRHRSGGKTSVKTDNQIDNHSTSRHIHNHETRRSKTNLHNHTPTLKGSMEELSTPPKTPPVLTKSNNHCGKIRVGSSVSSLITGSSGNSIVNELTKGESEGIIVLPKVSQIVRRFEDLGTGMGRESPDDDGEVDGNEALRRNFEEFKLEDVDMDSVGSSEDGGRPAGDGAEARAAVVQNGISGSSGSNNGGGSYEHFLEATGLSQKSILTPSRMYSNHRNVLKPKDVKHRSRILKAAAVSERSNSTTNGPIVKYWIEPFL